MTRLLLRVPRLLVLLLLRLVLLLLLLPAHVLLLLGLGLGLVLLHAVLPLARLLLLSHRPRRARSPVRWLVRLRDCRLLHTRVRRVPASRTRVRLLLVGFGLALLTADLELPAAAVAAVAVAAVAAAAAAGKGSRERQKGLTSGLCKRACSCSRRRCCCSQAICCCCCCGGGCCCCGWPPGIAGTFGLALSLRNASRVIRGDCCCCCCCCCCCIAGALNPPNGPSLRPLAPAEGGLTGQSASSCARPVCAGADAGADAAGGGQLWLGFTAAVPVQTADTD